MSYAAKTNAELIKELEQEGYTDVHVCPIPPNRDFPEHTHQEDTVHIITSGELNITDRSGTRTYRPGDRIEFPAGTTHQARGSTDSGKMIVGVKAQ
jgi:quercetin dioxygenase-like cupin family protein